MIYWLLGRPRTRPVSTKTGACHSLTHGAIRKRAARDGWKQNLSAKTKAKAEALVSKAAVSTEVSAERGPRTRDRVGSILQSRAARAAIPPPSPGGTLRQRRTVRHPKDWWATDVSPGASSLQQWIAASPTFAGDHAGSEAAHARQVCCFRDACAVLSRSLSIVRSVRVPRGAFGLTPHFRHVAAASARDSS